MTDKTDAEILQALWPGCTSIEPRALCPCCGWHFKKGLTDPLGEVVAMKPDMLLVCGQCLRALRSNDQLQFEPLDNAQINALPQEYRQGLAEMWQMAYISLMMCGPEPRGPTQ